VQLSAKSQGHINRLDSTKGSNEANISPVKVGEKVPMQEYTAQFESGLKGTSKNQKDS
jgi:hypothetical protein